MRRGMWLAALVMACSPPAEEVESEVGAVDVVMTTISNDYAVGSLSTVDRSDWSVQSDVASVHSDAVVRWRGDALWVLNRLRMDTLRRYELGSWVTPVWELSVGQGSNPHDVEICGGSLWVSRYETTALWTVDPITGTQLGQVDLAAFADADGIPEASGMVVVGDRIYVGLQRLRRDLGWEPSEHGTVVEIDCETEEVVRSWEVGPNPGLRALPGQDAVVVIDPDGVHRLSVDDGVSTRLWQADVGEITDVAFDGQGRAVAIAREGSSHTVLCGHAEDDTLVAGTSLPNYLSSLDITDDGEAWIAVRQGWEDPSTLGGVLVIDVETCEDLTAGAWLRPNLAPFSIEVL